MLRPLAVVLTVFALFAPAAHAADGKRYAVIVGVRQYDDPAFAAPEFSDRDATELAATLTAAGYEVTLLTDATGRKEKTLDPTKKNVEVALDGALRKCKRDDLILVAFSGHGVRPDVKSAGYLCPRDAKPLPGGKASLLPVEALGARLADSPVAAAVLLVDACRTAPDGDRPSGVDGGGLKVPDRVFALFSCSPGERSVEHKDIRHGAFFAQVVAGLNGAAADGDDVVTFAALAARARAEVPKRAAELVTGAKQTPAALVPGAAKASPVLARHPAAIPASEWEEYLAVWGRGSTKPFLVKYAAKRAAAWKRAAEAGSARGMMLLADCHEFGTGVPKDAKASAHWYGKSAERGNTFAMVGLGICYERGFGVPKDGKEAVKWFRKGAELGDPGCMHSLGMCYLRGEGVDKDGKEAVKWFGRAVDRGFAQVTLSLGMCYLHGDGVDKDEKEALRWFRKGVDMKHAPCAMALAFCYQDGDGVDKDEKEAARWFRTGAELGSADCALFLGLWYQKGRGVEKDEKTAVTWYRRAAELDSTVAMSILARCYLEGIGVEADPKQAMNWLRKAADLEDPDATFALGVCYLRGVGVDKDREEAVRWLRKAAGLGSAPAKELLKTLTD